MPFDQEDAPSGLGIRPFEPARRESVEHDEGAVRCACRACAGLVDSDATSPGGDPVSFLDAADRGDVAPNGKPSKTVAEAAYQLNRTYASWNDFWTQPGVSDVDNKWDDPYWGGAASVVTFAFRSTAPGTMPTDTSGFSRFNEQQIAMTLLALQSWSDVANIVFVRVGAGASGDAAYSNSATILFSNYSTADDGAAAFAYYPSQSASGGDVWVKSSLSYNANPVAGEYGPMVLIHEIGHAIGFSHPGEYNAGPGVSITYSENAEYYEDSRQYTVMSYFGASNTGASHGGAYAATILLDDIAAAQRTYGVNTTTRTGDTVYGFNSTADRPWFAATSATSKLIFAVWDAGGVDTLDFSGYSQAQIITLIPGHFSSVGGLTGNVAIAIGAVIENAIGGSGADTLIGNAAGNRLTGAAGNDTLTGNGGADVFVATVGGGADTITDFSAASDRIDVSAFGGYLSAVQSGLNTIVTVAASITFTLLNVTATALTAANFITGASPPPAGYNLINGTTSGETLNGTAASDQIYGLAGDDTLNGGDAADWLEGGANNDLLNGGTGADVMIGGSGDDTYVVDNAGDAVTEAAGGGADTVQTTLAAYTLGAEVENLTGTSGGGQALTGNGLANVIAGAGGADTLNGGEGDDRLNGGAGADVMTGGAGDDTYVVDNAGDTTVEAGGGGTDTVETGLATYTLAAEVENLAGTSGAGQALTGNSLANTITGGAGADTITGGDGADALRGNGGADVFVATVGGGADTIADFVAGVDRINVAAFGGYQSIVQSGTDTLVTVATGVTFRLIGVTASTVTAGSFIGLAGPNIITGTSAGNVLYGTAGVDHISGLDGNDTLRGGDGDDRLDGGIGADKLFGEAGNDTLIGGDSNDLMDGGAGADMMTGGLGSDTYLVDDAGDVVTEGVDVSKDAVQTALATYVLPANVETLFGTSASGQTLTGTVLANTINGAGGADTLHGLAGADILNGGAGGDTLYGGADSDKLYGDGGDDFLFGGDGNDALLGGDGVDTLRGEQGSDSLTGGAGADLFIVTLNGGADTITDFSVGTDRIDLSAYGYYQVIAASGVDTLITISSGVTVRLKGVAVSTVTDAIFTGLPAGDAVNEITGTNAAETIFGTGRADHIVGLAGIDVIRSGAGDDWIEGGTEADKLYGDAGADRLDGDAGNDQLFGGDGDDILTGGAGNDSLIGGAGADTYVMSLAGGADAVIDFQLGVDVIDATAFGGYQSIVQSGTDAVVTFASGVTLRLKNITAAGVTDASFIGLSGPAPAAPPAFASGPENPLLAGFAGGDAWLRTDLTDDGSHGGWLL